jgi:hypothetical protein
MTLESQGNNARSVAYIILNACTILAAGFGVSQGNASTGSAAYVILLVLLCSMPLLWIRRLNDRYGLLAIFMFCYFMMFGALSLQTLVLGSAYLQVREAETFITTAQWGVLLGAVLVLAGYRVGGALAPKASAGISGTDWSNTSILVVGLSTWLFGSILAAYYSIVIMPENSMTSLRHGFQTLGPVMTLVTMLGSLVQPLGVVILAYGYAKNRTPLWLLLVTVMVLLQLLLGFIIDTKETAALGILLVAMTQTVWDNKVPRGWAVGILVFIVVVFPVLQAARVVRGEHGLNRAQAFERVEDIVSLAWEYRQKAAAGVAQEQRSQTLFERVSLEAALEPIFEHVGADTPFLHGSTLVAIPYAFIPRILLPDKEDAPVGQLYNRTFNHAGTDDFTYISFSMLGEYYWNFGWPGVIAGMALTGLILGYIGARTRLDEVRSVTRLLIILVCIKALCLGFERGIGLSYVVWLRGIAAVGLLHLVFARAAASTAATPGAPESAPALPPAPVAPLFPNLLR